MDTIKMDFPSNPQYLQMLRLTTASLANSMGFDIERIEDTKVVVSEIFTYLIVDNNRINVEFNLYDNSLNINFMIESPYNTNNFNDVDLELKKQILLSLADDINFEDNEIRVVINKA